MREGEIRAECLAGGEEACDDDFTGGGGWRDGHQWELGELLRIVGRSCWCWIIIDGYFQNDNILVQ